MTPLDDFTETQMHLRRGAQDRLNQRPGHSRQSVEAALEFVANQTANGNIVDGIRRTKEPHHGCALFAAVRRAPERNRAQTIRVLFQVRSEEHTSELRSHHDLVCRLLLEKKKKKKEKKKI